MSIDQLPGIRVFKHEGGIGVPLGKRRIFFGGKTEEVDMGDYTDVPLQRSLLPNIALGGHTGIIAKIMPREGIIQVGSTSNDHSYSPIETIPIDLKTGQNPLLRGRIWTTPR